MITYSFVDDIFQVTFSSTIEYDDIINYLDEFSKIDYLPQYLLLLYDAKNVDFNFKPEEVETISVKAEESTQKYKSVKTAFLIDEPKLAVYSMLFSRMPVNNKTQRNIFATRNSALKWLNSFKKMI